MKKTLHQNFYKLYFYFFAFLKLPGEVISQNVQNLIIEHLQVLKYFSVLNKNTNWVTDPFNTDVTEITGSITAQENQLINYLIINN